MDIRGVPVGKDGRIRYFVEGRDSQIGYWDTLTDAAIVLRFLSGANMSIEERARAVIAIKEYDDRVSAEK